MNIEVVIQYQDLFDGEMPDPKMLLSNIPSKLTIGIMSMINKLLELKGGGQKNQIKIFELFCQSMSATTAALLWQRGIGLIHGGRPMFAVPFTMELISEALLNYVDDEDECSTALDEAFLNVFRAYMATTTNRCQQDLEVIGKSGQRGKGEKNNTLRLLWPHLITQLEFQQRINPFLEFHKLSGLIAFMENHKQYGPYMERFFRSMDCATGYEYLNRFAALLLHEKEKESVDGPDFLLPIRVDDPNIVRSFVIDPNSFKSNPDLATNHKGLKAKPIFRLSANEYVIMNYNYFLASFHNHIIFNFCKDSGIAERYSDKANVFDLIKSSVSEDFFEKRIFRSTMGKCFEKKHDTLLFFDSVQCFNPDCYYRSGNHVFIIEFKDYLLKSSVVDSKCFETIQEEINKKFVSYIDRRGKVKPKGISQMFNKLELLSHGTAFWDIDEKAKRQKLKLRNMIVYPIIVQTNVYFDLPGINTYLDELFQEMCLPIQNRFKRIGPVTMINLDYFLERILLFADSKICLKDEVSEYYQIISRRRKRWEKFGRLDDLFASFEPFSFAPLLSDQKLDYPESELFDNWERVFHKEESVKNL